MEQAPLSFYQERLKRYNQDFLKVKNQLYRSSMLRLVVFCLGALGVYLGLGNPQVVWGIVCIVLVLFVFLVSRHSDLQYERDRIKTLQEINSTEIKVLQRQFDHLPEGREFMDPDHPFSQDIDLFGRGSFYQYVNRTALDQGNQELASLLLSNSTAAILSKQEAVKELAQLPEWRQNYSAIATLVKTETPTDIIIKWLKGYKRFVPQRMRIMPIVFSAVSVLLMGSYLADFVSGWWVIAWLLLGLGITSKYLKRINLLAAHTSKVQSTFAQYQKLVLELENIRFESGLLKERQASILQGGIKTSSVLKEFSRILNALDQRNNIIIGLLGNGFLLRDLFVSRKIELWIRNHEEEVENWFKVIAFFDAYASLGNFAYNHPSYAFPILSEGTQITGENAGHPLLHPGKNVLNDFRIDKEKFLIITGANMAGKSTFLRTVSLQIMMANVGLPVCASKMEYAPIKLITSMRTSDSLTDDESYFFSELKRLKFIVDQIREEDYFIVLDEILKGTNSTDKAIGSRKFIERLVGSKSTGIIATHDLSLCEVAEQLPQVANYYFDAQIIDGELHFDYKFKKGICQNMNASFLLKKMSIVE